MVNVIVMSRSKSSSDIVRKIIAENDIINLINIPNINFNNIISKEVETMKDNIVKHNISANEVDYLFIERDPKMGDGLEIPNDILDYLQHEFSQASIMSF
jgi:hypothetical protein